MKVRPDMVVIRVPNDGTWDGVPPDGKMFVEMALDADGYIADYGKYFSVLEGDSYNNLDYDQIVLAKAIENGSEQLISFTLGPEEGEGILHVHEISKDKMNEALQHLLDIYYDDNDPSIQ